MSARELTPVEDMLLARFDRLIQQLRSLTDLQSQELATRGEEALGRIHADEVGIALQELASLAADVRSHLAASFPL